MPAGAPVRENWCSFCTVSGVVLIHSQSSLAGPPVHRKCDHLYASTSDPCRRISNSPEFGLSSRETLQRRQDSCGGPEATVYALDRSHWPALAPFVYALTITSNLCYTMYYFELLSIPCQI